MTRSCISEGFLSAAAGLRPAIAGKIDGKTDLRSSSLTKTIDVMGSVRFSVLDAELLYAFPSVEADVATIVRLFVFINRAAAPSYAEFAGCLVRASRAGIVVGTPGGFVVDRDWYEWIHQSDKLSENEIESMLRFQDEFVGVDFPEVMCAMPVLSEEDYQSTVAKLG